MAVTLTHKLAREDVLEAAFAWLCKRRRDYPPNADIWSFRFGWQKEKQDIQASLRAGIFRFQPLQRITLSCGERIDLWSARDALVLKAMTLVLAYILPVSQLCTHVKGNGGAKQAVRQVHDQLGDNRFILRSDVKSYYASIDHMILLDQLAVHIQDRGMLNLLAQYLQRTTEFGGTFVTCKRGISLGCPLSTLIGAFFLTSVDDIFERSGLFYVRFMDDFLIMARCRAASWRVNSGRRWC